VTITLSDLGAAPFSLRDGADFYFPEGNKNLPESKKLSFMAT
jgi:hypothetical protein